MTTLHDQQWRAAIRLLAEAGFHCFTTQSDGVICLTQTSGSGTRFFRDAEAYCTSDELIALAAHPWMTGKIDQDWPEMRRALTDV